MGFYVISIDKPLRSRHVKPQLKVPRFGIGLTQVTAQLHCVAVGLSPETLTIGWGPTCVTTFSSE